MVNKNTLRTIILRVVVVVALALLVSFAVMSAFATAVADYKDGTIIAVGIGVFVVASLSLTLWLHNMLNPYWRRAQQRKKTEKRVKERPDQAALNAAIRAALREPLGPGSTYDIPLGDK